MQRMKNKEEQKSNYTRSRLLIHLVRYGLCIWILSLALLLAGNTVSAASPGTAAKTDKKSTGTSSKTKTGKIITKKGLKYYKFANGRKAKKNFVTVRGKTYYFGKTGVMEKGWMKKGGEYYYFDRSSGVQKFNCKVDGIRIRKDGKAKKTDYNKKKIETMITAKNIMNKVTKPADSKSQKLKKVFDWVMLDNYYRQYRTLASARAKGKGWEITFANDIFKKGYGCCVSEACAFAFLAHECGYSSYICDDTSHAWTEINGRVYDTLFAQAKSYSNYYNSSYQTAHLYCAHKLKI